MALALLATGTATAGTSATATERSRASTERPWSGFRIDVDERAGGSWIGGWKLGRTPGRIVYRIDPDAVATSSGFDRPRTVTRVPGRGPHRAAGARATSRAAWILAKYGTYRYEIQSAAVDAALLQLLAGRDYGLRGRVGAARLRHTGEETRVTSFAATMLRDSTRLSGPYRVTVRQLGEAVIGGPVRLGMQVVVARSGLPLASVPVSVRTAGGTWHSAGETDAAGLASFDYVAGSAGPHPLVVRIGRVPEHRLLVLPPRRHASSRVVVAGRKHVLDSPIVARVKARPDATVISRPMVTDQRTSGSFRIVEAYGSAPGAATVVLHGPFGSADQATCQRKAFRVRHVPVAGNGHYQLPRLVLGRAGFYIWYVNGRGNSYNVDAAACAGVFRVRPAA